MRDEDELGWRLLRVTSTDNFHFQRHSGCVKIYRFVCIKNFGAKIALSCVRAHNILYYSVFALMLLLLLLCVLCTRLFFSALLFVGALRLIRYSDMRNSMKLAIAIDSGKYGITK